MIQTVITLDQLTGTVDVEEKQQAQFGWNTAGISRWHRSGWTILCWGDPAAANTDADLIRNILNGETPTFWGRSWIAVNHFRNQIKAGTDTLGLFPIWLYEKNHQVRLSTSRSELAKLSDSTVDADNARTLMAFGQLFDDQCLWQHTKQLPGRTTLVIDSQRGVKKTTDHSSLLGNETTKFDDALEALVESVRKCFNEDNQPLISLSGGLDSRLLLAAAKALGKSPTGLTYGGAHSADVKIAKQLAQATDISLFTGGNQAQHWNWSALKRIAQLGGGEVPLHHAHALLDASLLEQSAGRMLLTGTGAETTRAFYYDRGMPGYSLLGKSILRDSLMSKAQQYIQQEFFKTAEPFFQLAPEFREPLLRHLQGKLNEHVMDFQTPARFLDNFYLQNRVTRMVASGQQLLDQHYQRSHPFLDKDALFHMAHLPVRYKLASTFHRKAIQKLAPELADITWDKTNLALRNGMPWQFRYPALASRFGMNYWGKSSEPMFDYSQWIKTAPQTVLQKTLSMLQCMNIGEDSTVWLCLRSQMPFVGFSAVWSFLPHEGETLTSDIA